MRGRSGARGRVPDLPFRGRPRQTKFCDRPCRDAHDLETLARAADASPLRLTRKGPQPRTPAPEPPPRWSPPLLSPEEPLGPTTFDELRTPDYHFPEAPVDDVGRGPTYRELPDGDPSLATLLREQVGSAWGTEAEIEARDTAPKREPRRSAA
jgi:hypothetical protein